MEKYKNYSFLSLKALFLGRAIARRMSRLIGVPEDPGRWSDDHTLAFLQAAGEDLPGALVVGDGCLRRAQARALSPDPRTIVEAYRCPERYAEMAGAAFDVLPGSSAGGEQPKFLTHLQDGSGEIKSVLVKFSPPLSQATGRRWADLMVCEHLAAGVLSERGYAPSGTRVLDGGERRFFEIPRFDRVGLAGRRGVVTLAALHAEADSYGSGRAWVEAAASMREDELIGDETRSAVVRLHAFGELIGNTDMHAGNLAFWFEDVLPFRLAPAFDMLPMLWAPGPQGEIILRDFVPSPPLPAVRSEWREAAEWAEEFWDLAAVDPRLSVEFAGFAQKAREAVALLRKGEM